MKQNVYDYSFELRRSRKKTVTTTLTVTGILVVLLTLVCNWVLFPVFIRSDSMVPDLTKNSAVFVSPLFRSPKRGDLVYLSRLDDEKQSAPLSVMNKIVAFFTFQQIEPFGHTDRLTGQPAVRRVMGIPGDTIYMKDYMLFVKPEDKSLYLSEFEMAEKEYGIQIYSVPVEWDGLGSTGNMEPVTLGEDEYFVLADNRIEALDSRLWGNIPAERIRGKVVMEYFPFNKFRLF
ncbi:MAG: signal peptidase I [Treponema sp.]|jgi:signal peptidase I|nr:signal peptidase I [Treponema sp.]MBR6153765.1 signal peptidase I [Treponema sp.]MBR7080623.1 signal peptidase I [Treponema sp.]